MPRRWRIEPALVAVCMLLGGCSSVAELAGDAGEQQTQTRAISAVSEVELATSGELTLTGGDPPSLRITAGAKVIDHLTSEVRGDRLVLATDRAVHTFGRVRYELVLPAARTVQLSGSGNIQVASPSALRAVVLSGSGTVRVDGLATEELATDLSGSGNVTASGTATRQRVTIDGSGSYAAGKLTSQDADVRIGGSGDAELQVDRTLNAVITGSGSVTYRGSATVTQKVTGSGTVVHR